MDSCFVPYVFMHSTACGVAPTQLAFRSKVRTMAPLCGGGNIIAERHPIDDADAHAVAELWRHSQFVDSHLGTQTKVRRARLLAPTRRVAFPIARAGFVLKQAGQFAKPRLVASPALQRTTIDRLARLPDARRSDRLAIDLVMQARIIPGESAERDQPSGFGLAVADQALVVHLGEAIGGNHPLPMRHQARILAIIECEIAAIAHEML